MAEKNALKSAADKLWECPDTGNWENFAKVMKKSNAKYYKTIYVNGKVKKLDDLKKSWVVLYDDKRRVMTKVPVYKTTKKEIEGALIYLKGLLNANVVE